MEKARKGESGSTPGGTRADVISSLVLPARSANAFGCTSGAGVGFATACSSLDITCRAPFYGECRWNYTLITSWSRVRIPPAPNQWGRSSAVEHEVSSFLVATIFEFLANADGTTWSRVRAPLVSAQRDRSSAGRARKCFINTCCQPIYGRMPVKLQQAGSIPARSPSEL